jgi:hypothetical protein
MRYFLILIISYTLNCQAQELTEFNVQRSKIDQRLMLTLGSWSSVNFVGSGIGWAIAQPGEARYFHQMNVMWNTVNLGLAIPGYIKAKKMNSSLTLAQSIRDQHRTEKIFLFNTGLDIAYITSGFLLRNEAKYNLEKRDQFNGFGNSLLLQGGFLFLFDIAAHAIHVRHANNKLSPIMDRLTLSSTGVGLTWSLN